MGTAPDEGRAKAGHEALAKVLERLIAAGTAKGLQPRLVRVEAERRAGRAAEAERHGRVRGR